MGTQPGPCQRLADIAGGNHPMDYCSQLSRMDIASGWRGHSMCEVPDLLLLQVQPTCQNSPANHAWMPVQQRMPGTMYSRAGCAA